MVVFKNAQWAVTDWGLEAVRPGAPIEYLIPAHRLLGRQLAWSESIMQHAMTSTCSRCLLVVAFGGEMDEHEQGAS
jgi:hypothetical protein